MTDVKNVYEIDKNIKKGACEPEFPILLIGFSMIKLNRPEIILHMNLLKITFQNANENLTYFLAFCAKNMLQKDHETMIKNSI